MNASIIFANYVAVALFGSILSVFFCPVQRNRKTWFALGWANAAILFFHGIVFLIGHYDYFVKLYPFIMHLPLALVLCRLTGRKVWSFISVIAAYLCCQLRYFIALLITTMIAGDEVTQAMVELVVTLPFLLFLIRFIAPSVRIIAKYPISTQLYFGIIPILYYLYDYITTVYTTALFRGMPIAVEFMSFVCAGAYLAFTILTSLGERKSMLAEQTKNSLTIQVAQSLREISALHNAQQESAAYRHDMRHHLQYISACINEERLAEAQSYIQSIDDEINTKKIQRFCENEELNLILSAFKNRMENENILMECNVFASQNLSINASDLCVLLSNILENALHGCAKLSIENDKKIVRVQGYEKNKKLYLEIVNPCKENVPFENGLPITDIPSHGMGVRSICTVVEKYDGIYSFSVKDGLFIVRIAI